MSASEDLWLPTLRGIVRQQESEREQRLALNDRLSAFLSDAVLEVDNLSADPALHADSASDDLRARHRKELEEINSRNQRSVSIDYLMELESGAAKGLCRRASQIYRGEGREDQSGLISVLQMGAGVLGDPDGRLDDLRSAFTHVIVLNAVRKLTNSLGVSISMAQSLLKLALQSAQASLLTSSRPF